MKYLEINDRKIGSGYKPYVVAEISANHNGCITNAFKLIEAAKRCGADAVKIQSYEASTITLNSDKKDFQITSGPWKGQTLYELYKSAETPFSWHEELFEYAKRIGITLFSSPFDFSAVDLLRCFNVPAYKVASFEIVDIPLIKKIAIQNMPVIISTGMANLFDISNALEAVFETGNTKVILLHCVSGYPTPINEMNLNTIKDLSEKFNVIVGLSDHTLGVTSAIASVALGACFIEKHLTLDRKQGGVDSEFSLEPQEFHYLCDQVEQAWLALGTAAYEKKKSEKGNLIFRRSLYAIENIKKGERFTLANIKSVRPGYGLHPKYLEQIIGKKAKIDIEKGIPLTFKLIENSEDLL